jgi:hypothetical protein
VICIEHLLEAMYWTLAGMKTARRACARSALWESDIWNLIWLCRKEKNISSTRTFGGNLMYLGGWLY